MHYRCKCGYESIEYTTRTHECPNCGNTILEFEHVEFHHHDGNFHSHWVTIDVTTDKLIGIDPCDEKYPLDKIARPCIM